MSTATINTEYHSPSFLESPNDVNNRPFVRDELESIVGEIERLIAPVWPLEDYVAVNPFMGYQDRSFLDVHSELNTLAGTDVLMPWAYFKQKWQSGKLSQRDLTRALHEVQRQYPALARTLTAEWIGKRLDDEPAESSEDSSECKVQQKQPRTFTDLAGNIGTESWSELVVHEISKYCATHFDGGQARIASPWKSQPLLLAWINWTKFDRRIEYLGGPSLRAVIDGLPSDPLDAIDCLLKELDFTPVQLRNYLLALIHSIGGWASFAAYRKRRDEARGIINTEVQALLAIRLAWDVAFKQQLKFDESKLSHANYDPEICPLADHDACARYVLLVASEIAYRRSLVQGISKNLQSTSEVSNGVAVSQKTAQFVMCIDVRSERMRRQLESLSSDLETVGFAGFFGVPFELVPLGASHGPAQCPVLLQPAVKVQEAVHECHGDHHKQMIQQRWITRTTRRIWKAFQGSAASCFTCVESIGVGYLAKLISGRMALSMNPKSARYDGVAEDLHDKLSPVWHATCEHTKQQQVATAESILKNLGIGKNLAKIVVLCGHGSATRNNPYRAGLDCGACGGHTGEANARVVANLLNDPEVRSGLAKKGSSIPCDTWFVAALHNTTTDEIELFDTEAVPAHLDLELSLVRQWTEDAAELNRSERAPTLNQSVPDRLITNSLDWATTRPEWGLAGNAAFVVGSRTLTKGLKLEGRVFLHNYNHEQDVDHKTLELIMTAPMIVTNWINLQYYASTVDNHRYGAGNKVLHNVVGQFGTYEGNGGDLRTGLPWQSVHDGEQFRHEPLRLQVVIQAPLSAIDGILAKHPHVYELVTNGWLTLLAVEGSRTYVYAGSGVWEDSVLA